MENEYKMEHNNLFPFLTMEINLPLLKDINKKCIDEANEVELKKCYREYEILTEDIKIMIQEFDSAIQQHKDDIMKDGELVKAGEYLNEICETLVSGDAGIMRYYQDAPELMQEACKVKFNSYVNKLVEIADFLRDLDMYDGAYHRIFKFPKDIPYSLRQIALVYYYNGTPITNENCKEIAKKYNLLDGFGLYNKHYILLPSEARRLEGKYAIKNIRGILSELTIEGLYKAIEDLKKLES